MGEAHRIQKMYAANVCFSSSAPKELLLTFTFRCGTVTVIHVILQLEKQISVFLLF